MSATPQRAYSAAHFALELDGSKQVGLFRSIEGGGVKVEVINNQDGAHHETLRQLGRPSYEDIKVQVGMAMSEPFYDWIKDFFRGDAVRKTGAIVAADFYYLERARREFDQAMISELAFPKLEGTDQSACYMTVTISPETITYAKGSGAKLETGGGFATQKLWAACNFTFSIDGFKDACTRVTKIDPFTIKQKMIEYQQGQLRHAVKVPGRIEYPNLTFYVPEADAKPFFDHHAKYGLGGDLQKPNRLTGQIETQDNAGGSLFRIDFFGAEIFNIAIDKSDASSESIKQVKVELCVESMSFMYLRKELA
ncbi:MAG: phage tail protein [Kofleriaceae bacterium]|nr:phage tail protein [Kofleriaceae bacterium]MCB9574796.1 phage tail protein [Kofleriaceae bacterium]